MAATTGGASPKANLRMAMYGNYLRYKKIRYPEYAHEMPFPIGGRYAMNNMDMHKKLMSNPIDSKTNPKRHNFRSNFLGDKSSATIDEQMMNLFDPSLNVPPAGAYGTFENKVAKLAKKENVAPRDYQDVAWAGAKKLKNPDRYEGSRSMMEEVNQAIERTSKITGLTPKQVLVEGIIKGKIPIYGAVGLLGANAMMPNDDL